MSGSRWISFLVYTLLRLLVFVAVWLLVQVITPWRGLVAVAVAILISGGISLFLLDRPRGQVALGVDAFMRRINDRIEASARAEDVEDDGPVARRADAVDGAGRGSAETAGQGADHQPQGGGQTEGEDHDAGLLQHRDQGRSADMGVDRSGGADHREQADQAQEQPPGR